MKRAFTYDGGEWPFKCNNLEVIRELFKSGETFRTANMDYYYQSVPFDSKRGIPTEDIACLRRICVTSPTTKTYRFYKPEKVEVGGEIFFGKSLENLVLKEMKLWIKNLNVKSMKAFSGRSLKSYIMGLPDEIVNSSDGFFSKLWKTVQAGFTERMENCNFEDLEDVHKASQKTVEYLKERRNSPPKIREEEETRLEYLRKLEETFSDNPSEDSANANSSGNKERRLDK